MSRTICLGIALVCGIMLISTGFAGADEISTVGTSGLGYSICAGAAFPINSDVNTQTSLDVQANWYGSVSSQFGEDAAVGVGVDWIPTKRNDGGNVNLVPIMLNYKAYAQVLHHRFFFNAGAGVLAATDSIAEMQIRNGGNFGWNAGIGLNLSRNAFVQCRFIAGSHPADDGMVSVQIGASW